jgi:predicted O-methyltransferase YrrM
MSAMDAMPLIVQRAVAAATAAGFPLVADGIHPSCCSPDTGRLLAVLAAGCAGGRIGEIGTGTGYGTAWMASAMPSDARLVTIELDAERAAVARDLFAGDDRVEVIGADATKVIDRLGPFALLFADGAHYGRDADALRSLIAHVAIGGRLVVDDVTPLAALAADSPLRTDDPKRAAFFATPELVAAEVVAPTLDQSTLVATRLR